MGRIVGLALALVAAGLLLAAGGPATPDQSTKLHARVGPGFTISLTNDAGGRVTKLDPGTYEIEVEDESAEHNFHLTGPGVDRATAVEAERKELWTVTFRDGVYTYVCDPHSATMNGSFTVGNVPTAPTPTPTPASAITAKTKLRLTSGPGFTITLRTSGGKAVTAMRRGTYTVTVRDLGRIHNAHLVAPGYNRRTSPITYTGTQTWKVRLGRTGTLRFLCDPHARTMKGSARVIP
jgi:plastocyanin